jgi:hypothetical protein
MSNIDVERYHRLYGNKRKRTTYQGKDYLDYLLMLVLSAAFMLAGYGLDHPLAWVGVAVCLFMAATFPINHGVEWRVPLVLRAPQDVIFLLVHKIQNIRAMYFVAIALLVAESVLIRYTPDWPHHVDWMRRIGLGLFWVHLGLITLYRTAILIAHLRKRDLVREVLAQSAWRARVTSPGRTVFSIVHGYLTGLLTHIVYLIPWYLILQYVDFSLVLAPATIVIGLIVQRKNVKSLNDWFYRDHWLSHNSEIDFVYMHGMHHDAIPSGMIAVAGNGPLEGLMRSTIAFPIPFFNPVAAAFLYTYDVKLDIDTHQYIPGIFPKLSREFLGVAQHSLHHFGMLEPYGFAINLDQPISDELKKFAKVLPDELKYSWRIERDLNGYEWDNAKFRWYLALVDKYHDAPNAGVATAAGADAGGEAS